MKWLLPSLLCLAMVVGCSPTETGDTAEAVADGDAETISKTTEAGPVKATISLSPSQPRLGDMLTLTLRVESTKGVEVEMPPFGEALGRFTVVQFVPRDETTADGVRVQSHVYSLQAGMSGRQRVPPLRLEFSDNRATEDAGVAGPRELLTEELPISVASVLPEGAVASELAPARGGLDESPGLALWRWLLAAAGLIALVAGYFGVRWWRSAARRRARVSAYDKALARIRALEKRGLPSPDDADEWYVELSSIVRRYLEDRFEIRAPELTTEEFLREARRSHELTEAHRSLLSQFLETCDMVKFAGHHPQEDESKDVLEHSRAFLGETRLVDRSREGKAA